MPSTAKYQWMTVMVGLFAVPVPVSLAVSFGAAPFDGPVRLAVGAVVAVTVSGAIWFFMGGRGTRPDRWLPALMPVAAVPAAYLLFWVIAYSLTDGIGDTLNVFALPAFPYLVLSGVVLFVGPPVLVPVTLIAVLVASVAGFILGTRRRLPSGKPSLAGVLAACLVLGSVAGVQVSQHVANSVTFSSEPSMDAEVDLSMYRPFDPANNLPSPAKAPTLTITDDFPRLDGATALYPLYGAIAETVYRQPRGLDEEGEYRFVDEYVPCSTTAVAYDRLIAGQVDAVFAAQPSKGQMAKAKAGGVELKATPIGREAFVFFVNTDNPVSNLTLDQVRDIYSKRITNWNQVGGKDEAIIAFQRPDDSGSQTAILAMVMKDQGIAQPLREERISGMGGIMNEVAGYRDLTGAIGYSFRWYATVMNPNPRIRLVAIGGVEPTAANIRNGSYPLIAELNIVTAGSTNPNVAKLIDWTVSPEGQALIEKTGYVGR
ncbi:MAG: PstS family phosphate ABC transporter substrate-binding protein [Propionicimonas sp.]